MPKKKATKKSALGANASAPSQTPESPGPTAPQAGQCGFCEFVAINPASKELQDHLRRVHHHG